MKIETDVFFESIQGDITKRIKERLKRELEPIAAGIIEEEVAAFSVGLSKYMCFKTMTDRIVIELFKVERKR